MPTTGNGGYASKYTDGAAVDKRLDQGYYDDIIAAGIAAGIYTADAAPSKAELDKKMAKGEVYIVTFAISDKTVITKNEYDSLKKAIQNGMVIMTHNTEDGNYSSAAMVAGYDDANGIDLSLPIYGLNGIAIMNIAPNLGVSVVIQPFMDLSNVLQKNNTETFTPTGDYNPATKKYVDDNALDSSLKETLDYMCKKATVTTLSGLPSDAANVIANVTSATNLTHSGLAEPRQQMIRVNNTTSSDITQALPTTGIYESMAGASVVIPANNYIELSLWAINGKISIRVGEHA